MQIEFDFTKEDYLEYNMHHISTSKTLRRMVLIQQYGLSLVYLIVPFALARFTEIPFVYWMVVFGIVYLFWILFYPRYFKSSARKRIDKMVDEGKNTSMFGKHVITLDEDGMLETTAKGESKISWDAVEKVEETDGYIYIYISSVNAYVIPVRAFESEGHRNGFLDTLKKYCQDKNTRSE